MNEAQRKPITILLVDDHAVVRDGLRALIMGHQDLLIIGDAGDGRAAVVEAQRLLPDVVVMDIALPELDGIEATQRIVEKFPHIRVLILSMYLTSEHVFRALRAGAQGYVLKESAGDEVVDAIRAVHNGKRYLSHRIMDSVIDDYMNEGAEVSPLDSLSLRERDVLLLIVAGHTNAVIADKMSLSTKTIETYRARIMRKLKVRNTIELVKFAMRLGIAE